MIFKTFLTLAFLLVGYQIVSTKYLKDYNLSLNQQQQNVIDAQEYIYNLDKSTSLMVGSSMSKRFDLTIMKGIDNLGMNGGGVLTGLHIAKLCNDVPDTLYVEASNVLFRPLDNPMLDGLASPLMHSLRKQMTIFREKNQPCTFISWRLLRPLNMLFGSSPSELSTEPSKKGNTVSDVMRKEIDEKNKSVYKSLQDTLIWKADLHLVKDLLREYERKGSVIVLFEMPTDVSIYTSAQALFVRRWIKSQLPYSFAELKVEQVATYRTTDGIHLDGESARRFSAYFNAQVRKLGRSNHVATKSFMKIGRRLHTDERGL